MTKPRRAKGEGTVFKDNQGYWNGQVVLGHDENGKIKYKKFRSKKQSVVLEKMNNFKLGIGKGTQPTVNHCSYEQFLFSWLETTKKISIRPTSYDSLLISAKQATKRIGHYSLPDITSEIIQICVINAMVEENYAYGTIHKVYVLINESMNYALVKDYIQKNPCIAVKLPKKEMFVKKEIRFFTDDEIVQFKNTAHLLRKNIAMPIYQYGNILCLIIYTGLRISELCALQWKDVDFGIRKLTISKAVVVVYDHKSKERKRTLTVQHTTKSGKIRTIPLNDKAIEILQQQKELVGGGQNDYIVNGSGLIPDKTVVANSYATIAKAANISNPNGVHTLRHTFASLMIRRGGNIKVLSEILGHASTAFTYNTYVHIIDDQKVDALDLLNDI